MLTLFVYLFLPVLLHREVEVTYWVGQEVHWGFSITFLTQQFVVTKHILWASLVAQQ